LIVVAVKCGPEPSSAVEYRCHKLMIRGFLRRQLGQLADSLLEEIEEILLPDTQPAAFKRYLDLVYGLADGSAIAGYGLEGEPALKESIEDLFLISLSPVLQGVI
jgi:hypothetical protein